MLYRLLPLFIAFTFACATAETPSDGQDPDASTVRSDPDAAVVTADAAPAIDAPMVAPDAAIAQVDCTEDTTIACGELAEHSLFFADASIEGYSCESQTTDGVENVYTFTPPTTGTVTITLDVLEDTPIFEDDFDLYVLENTCSLSTCLAEAAAAGDESLSFTATGGVTYYIVVEAFSVGLLTLRNYDLSVQCL